MITNRHSKVNLAFRMFVRVVTVSFFAVLTTTAPSFFRATIWGGDGSPAAVFASTVPESRPSRFANPFPEARPINLTRTPGFAIAQSPPATPALQKPFFAVTWEQSPPAVFPAQNWTKPGSPINLPLLANVPSSKRAFPVNWRKSGVPSVSIPNSPNLSPFSNPFNAEVSKPYTWHSLKNPKFTSSPATISWRPKTNSSLEGPSWIRRGRPVITTALNSGLLWSGDHDYFGNDDRPKYYTEYSNSQGSIDGKRNQLTKGIREIVIYSKDQDVKYSIEEGQVVRILARAEAGQTMWVFVKTSYKPEAVYAKTRSNEYALTEKLSEFNASTGEAYNMYYAKNYGDYVLDLGYADYSNIAGYKGEVTITVKKGEDPKNLQTIQTITLSYK